MKYRGYEMTAYYYPNLKELKNGRIQELKPKEIDHITTEHMVTGEQLPNSLSFKEAKAFIKMYVLIDTV